MTFFVQYPPSGDDEHVLPRIPIDWEPGIWGSRADVIDLDRQLRKLREEFLETGNFLCVFDAFRQATERRMYPPIWVLDLLQSRFASFLSDRGAKLDTAFGFSRGRGEATPWEASERRDRDLKLGRLVLKLESLGLKRPQASRALSSLLERLPDGEVVRVGRHSERLRRVALSGKAIHKAVDRVAESLEFARIMFKTKRWSDEERRSALVMFYKSELPPSLVRELWGK